MAEVKLLSNKEKTNLKQFSSQFFFKMLFFLHKFGFSILFKILLSFLNKTLKKNYGIRNQNKKLRDLANIITNIQYIERETSKMT